MARVTCPYCGGDHPKWECKRPDTKSTGTDLSAVVARKEAEGKPDLLPVDTKPRRGRPKMDAPTSARADYQREYVAKWRRGEVGNKHRR